MRKINIVAVILLLCVGCKNNPPTPAVDKLTNQNNVITKEQINLIYKNLNIFPNATQVSFAIIEKGLVRFYGVKRESDTLLDSENYNKAFEIGSISKVFTSTLLANFVVNGDVKLDDKINDYLKVDLNDNIQISFKELANHTAGLPRMPSNIILGTLLHPSNPYKTYDEEKLEEFLTESISISESQGKKSKYSNLGVGLLGYTLCKMANKDYNSLLHDKVFLKYKMINSTAKREDIKDKLVKGLDADGNETPNWDLGAMAGAGAILSTVEDLSKFALAQFDTSNQELELTRIKTFIDSTGMDLGLGWHIVKSKSTTEFYWHNGGTGGYTSSMVLDIGRQNGIIILSNISAFHDSSRTVDGLCFEFAETLKQE